MRRRWLRTMRARFSCATSMMTVRLLSGILRHRASCARIVEAMISRRFMLLSTLAAGTTAGTTFAAGGKMTLAMHQNTSAGVGYRKSLEGWARAGIKNVEITSALLDDFLKTDT